jgi:hypothetical protein
LYIGIVGYALSPFVIWALYYAPFIWAAPTGNVLAIALGFCLEEAIRKSHYPQHTKIMAACLVAVITVTAYAIFMAWTFQQIHQQLAK